MLHLICGSTGAGKTTYALRLTEETGGVRFSIDEWMTTLFWKDSPQPVEFAWAIERVIRCETQIFAVARQLAERSTDAILDLGFTTSEQRDRIAAMADRAGLPVTLHFIDIDAEERWRRVQSRNAARGETYAMQVDRRMFDFREALWEPPTADEMARLNGIRVGA